MGRKYVITQEISINGTHRIRALIDIPSKNVKAGDLGGFVESEYNLDHAKGCWIFDNATCEGDARVTDWAELRGNALVMNRATVSGSACVRDDSFVHGDSVITGYAELRDHVIVRENATIDESASINEYAGVAGRSVIKGNACLRGYVYIDDGIVLTGYADISENRDILTIAPVATEDNTLTLYRCRNYLGYHLRIGCWEGSLDELEEMIEGDSWPSARTEEQRAFLRPEFRHIIDLCQYRVTSWSIPHARSS